MNRRQFLGRGGFFAAGAAATQVVDRLPMQAAAAMGGTPASFAGVGESHGSTPAPATSTEIIWRVQTTRKVVALTLDDGPVPRYTTDYLDMLEERKVRATFSLVGASALEHRDIVQRQVRLGHQLENHSYSHRDLGAISAAEATQEVERGAEVLERLSGRAPRFFRPPKGNVSGAALATVGRLGEDVLMWSLQLHERVKSVQENIDHVVDNIVPGTILLAHDAAHRRIDRRIGLKALPVIIDRLRDQGYEFVTVEELLEARSG